MCQKSQSQSKRRNKRKGVTTLRSSGGFCWWPRSLGGGRVRDGLGLLMEGMCLVVWMFRWWTHTWWSGCSGGGCKQQGAGPLSFYTL